MKESLSVAARVLLALTLAVPFPAFADPNITHYVEILNLEGEILVPVENCEVVFYINIAADDPIDDLVPIQAWTDWTGTASVMRVVSQDEWDEGGWHYEVIDAWMYNGPDDTESDVLYDEVAILLDDQ